MKALFLSAAALLLVTMVSGCGIATDSFSSAVSTADVTDTAVSITSGLVSEDAAIISHESAELPDTETVCASAEATQAFGSVSETAESAEVSTIDEAINPVCITFPAHQYARNQYNAAALDIEPFTLTIDLPEGWYVQLPDESEYGGNISSEHSAVYICRESGEKAGVVDYNTYALNFEGAEELEEIPYRAVYSDLMMSNHSTWDCDYDVVKDNDTVNAATCSIFKSSRITASGMDEYSPAALAYSKKLLVYVCFSFVDGAVSNEQIAAIARSVNIC